MWEHLLKPMKPQKALTVGSTSVHHNGELQLEITNIWVKGMDIRLGPKCNEDLCINKEAATRLAAFFTVVAEQLEE